MSYIGDTFCSQILIEDGAFYFYGTYVARHSPVPCVEIYVSSIGIVTRITLYEVFQQILMLN